MRYLFFLFLFLSFGLVAQEESAPLDPPNPADLKPSWWKYYDVDAERLTVRIQKTEEILQNIMAELSAQNREDAAPVVKEIIIQLRTYQELVKRPLILQPVEEHVQETYSFSEFLGLIDRHNQLELMLDTTRHQIKIEKANLRSDQSYVDSNLRLIWVALNQAQTGFW